MVSAKSSHLERIGHDAAGFQGEILYVCIDIVVSYQHCVSPNQLLANLLLQSELFCGRDRRLDVGPCLRDTRRAFGVLDNHIEVLFHEVWCWWSRL